MAETDNGWGASAGAWIAEMAGDGDFARRHVLDAPMLARVRQGGFRTALDLGCGEGRFCRMLRAEGIAPTGLEPERALREEAMRRDPGGRYVEGRAEALPFADASFDLVVSYLSLIDIDDLDAAISEAVRVLAPEGSLLIANLNPFSTAGTRVEGGAVLVDDYLEPRPVRLSWRGISVRNWHRPMAEYMRVLLGTGLRLVHFDEPAPTGGPAGRAARYRRCPYFHVMEWRKV